MDETLFFHQREISQYLTLMKDQFDLLHITGCPQNFFFSYRVSQKTALTEWDLARAHSDKLTINIDIVKIQALSMY